MRKYIFSPGQELRRMVFVTISFTAMLDIVSSAVGEEKETRVQVRKEEI